MLLIQARAPCSKPLPICVWEKVICMKKAMTTKPHHRPSGRRTHVLSFMRIQIDYIRSCGRLGTARNYERAAASFSHYLGGKDLPLSAVTEPLIEGYNDYLLSRGIVRNSVSFYMRILRAVYNKAVRLHLVKQAFPFQNVYTGVDRTRKRAVDRDIIAGLFRLDLASGTPYALARDLFMFSFFTRGMAFVDIAFLQKTDIHEGMIHYTRRKTGQPLSIRVEPDIKEIMDRYADATSLSPYVFPILTDVLPDVAYRQYQSALNTYNRTLHRLSKMLPVECDLTSYTSRHSWATAARNHNVPVSVISAGLGHTSEHTTRIYLAMLENSVIDAANQEIIADFCDDVSVQETSYSPAKVKNSSLITK